MPNHNSGPVDAPGDSACAAHQPLRLMLAAKVRVREPLGLFEHVFPKRAAVQSGHGNGRGVMETARRDFFSKGNGVAGALGVGLMIALGRVRTVRYFEQM